MAARQKTKRRFNVRFRNLACPPQARPPGRRERAKYEYFFDRAQTWAKPQVDLDFWDETSDIKEAYAQPDDEVSQQETLPTAEAWSTTATPAPGQIVPPSPPPRQIGWPFRNDEEAMLYRHCEKVAFPWVDVSDRQQRFREYVHNAIFTSPMLLYALCAVSSRHLCRTSSYPAVTPLVYQDKCLDFLLPMLEDTDVMNDDIFLVTTCILRIYEEIDSPSVKDDERLHLLGASLLQLGPPFNLSSSSGSVRHTIVWCQLRQEIYVSISQQQPMRIDLGRLIYDPEKCVDDIAWSNRSVWHTAQVLGWAFGPRGGSADEWRTLQDIIAKWENDRPSTFDPIFSRPADLAAGRQWPDMWFAEIEHVHGALQVAMAKIILISYDPTLPKMGPRAKTAMAEMKAKVRSEIRHLCGIARTNSFEPAWNGACTFIVGCSQWIEDAEEQTAFLQFLEEAERRSGWPTGVAVVQLRKDWNV